MKEIAIAKYKVYRKPIILLPSDLTELFYRILRETKKAKVLCISTSFIETQRVEKT